VLFQAQLLVTNRHLSLFHLADKGNNHKCTWFAHQGIISALCYLFQIVVKFLNK
jgi:hypothetical protein